MYRCVLWIEAFFKESLILSCLYLNIISLPNKMIILVIMEGTLSNGYTWGIKSKIPYFNLYDLLPNTDSPPLCSILSTLPHFGLSTMRITFAKIHWK